MGTTYTSTIQFRCRKHHECVGCGTKFSYLLHRAIQGTSSSSAADAEKNAVKLLEQAAVQDVDLHACPKCGLVQPDMFADVVRKRLLIAACIGAVGLGIALILGVGRITNLETSAYVAVGTSFAAFIAAVFGMLHNPNRDPQSNLRTLAPKGHLALLRCEAPGGATAPAIDVASGMGGFNLLGVALLGAVILAAALPPVLLVANGWARNTSCYPEVVGAGDSARFYFDEEIESCKGMWNGTVETAAKVQGAPAVPGYLVQAETEQARWGDTITGKNVSNATNRMWADVQFLQQPDLAGRTVQIDFKVGATYPYALNGGFKDMHKQFQHTSSVVMASAGAGTLFHRSWWMGQLGGGVLVFCAAVCFYAGWNSLRGLAKPTMNASVEDRNRPPQDPLAIRL